jgi:hypothetical protein
MAVIKMKKAVRDMGDKTEGKVIGGDRGSRPSRTD